jgi:hypothetical protein
MTTALHALVTDALSVYRLTRLATRDELTRPLREKYLEPLLALDTVRDVPGELLPDDPTPRGVVIARLAYLATCPWCLSVWLAAAVTVARRTLPDRWAPVADLLAAAALAGLLLDRDRS